MEIFLAVLVLLALIASSNIINRFLPFIPVPLIQVGLGILVAAFPSGLHISLNPELFFVLFIAPLLFNDGKRTPRDELWKLRAPILLLALGLVFATVIVAGYTIHWMIPSIPLPAAFALAAILSPTDVVAVSALSSRVNMPKGIMRLLEGEGLMNDASGLVAFKFAIAATVTGAFSIAEASFSFVLIAAGGLLTGFILSFFIIRFRYFLRRLGMDDVTMHIILQILTPFVIYLAAEEIGVSGILAVVAGGVTHAIEQDRMEANLAKLQIASSNTWNIILFILNGLVFVLLGLQIPDVSTVIFQDEAFNNMQVISYILIIT
ncbi:cation:proton antiporter, partial [Bacillus altitudinis]